MASDATIKIKIDANTGEARVIKRELDKLGDSGDRVARSGEKMTKSFNLLRGAMVALGGVLSIQQFARLADTITNINTKLGNVTKTTSEFNKAFDDLFNVAQNTGTEFTATVDTFNRLNTALPESISQTRDLTKVVELLQKGFAASGTEASAARGAITQLTQGLASNFQASSQEINSLIDAAPLLAKVIAEQLGGKAAIDLKRFAEAGILTTESFLDAVIAAEKALNTFVLPPTIERSVIRLRNEFLLFASGSETLEEASLKLAGSINTVADNLDNIIRVIGVLIGASLPLLIKQFALSLPTAISATSGALTALTAIIAANPIGAIAVGISAAISAFFLFRKEIFEALDTVKIFGVDVTDVFFTIKNASIEVFEGLARTLTLPFKLAYNAINNTVRNIQLLANKVPGVDVPVNDFISQTQTIGDTFRANGQIGSNIISRTASDMLKFKNRNLNAPELPNNPSLPVPNPADPNGALDGFKETKKEIKETTKETENLAKTVEKELGGSLNNVTLQIERDFARAFKDAFSSSEGGFDRFLSGMKASFSNFIGEIAFQAGRPIALNLVGGIAGAAGMSMGSNPAMAALGGGAGGPGGFDLGNLLSLGKSALGGLNAPIFGAGSMIGGGINSIGASLGLTNANFVGPMLPGTSSLASAFTPMAGLAGFGGNMLGNLIFGGDRGIGSSIGGGLGGIAGTAIGANMGTILGMAGGPVGALAGAFLGNAVGGLFGGGSQPSNAAGIGFNVSGGRLRTGMRSSDEASSARLEQIGKAGNSITDNVNNLLEMIGANLENAPEFRVGSTRREPGLATISGQSGTGQSGEFIFNSFEKAVEFALTNVLSRAELGGVSDEFEQVFRDIFKKGGSFQARAQEALEASEIFRVIEGFENVEQKASPLRDALNALDAQFENLKKRAQDLGLPVDKLTENFEKQRKSLLQDALKPLQDFLDSQALSSISTLSATEKLSVARKSFDENLEAIRSGNLSGLNQLTSQASTLLNIGRDVFASGEGFSSLEGFVRQSVAGVPKDLGADMQLDINRDIVASNAQQTSILAQVNAEIQALREENRKLRKSMERVGNAVVQFTS